MPAVGTLSNIIAIAGFRYSKAVTRTRHVPRTRWPDPRRRRQQMPCPLRLRPLAQMERYRVHVMMGRLIWTCSARGLNVLVVSRLTMATLTSVIIRLGSYFRLHHPIQMVHGRARQCDKWQKRLPQNVLVLASISVYLLILARRMALS